MINNGMNHIIILLYYNDLYYVYLHGSYCIIIDINYQ